MFKIKYIWLLSAILFSLNYVSSEAASQEQDASAVLELTDSNFYQLLTPNSEWVIAL